MVFHLLKHMKNHLFFVLKYVTIGLAVGCLYLLLISPRINQSATQQPQLLFSYAPAINKINPSVVSIYTQSAERVSNRGLGLGSRNPYQTKNYLGSGLIVTKNGHITTNQHVISGATRVTVFLWDNQAFEASYVGQDSLTDLAVIKIDAENLTPAEFADSDLVNTGDVVLAIGNPYGLNQSASLGIVSATGRRGLSDNQNPNNSPLENFIQTDAAINQGNSGGPLINPLGQVVGLSTASYSQIGAEGINFAIPSNDIAQVSNLIIQYGKVPRGWLGLYFMDNTTHTLYNIPKPTAGIMVMRVHLDGAADQAGIETLDVITHLNDNPVNSFAEYRQQLYNHTIGETVKLTGINADGPFSKHLVIQPPPTANKP